VKALDVPHGCLWTFHQKSTNPNAMNSKALCGMNSVTILPGIGPLQKLRRPQSGSPSGYQYRDMVQN